MDSVDYSSILSDTEILRRLRDVEDSFTERKSFGDFHKDVAKTVCAFANSAPFGYPCILYIGVRNDGTLETHSDDELDRVQQTLTKKCGAIYPPVYTLQKVLTGPGGVKIVAVVIPGSSNRPHFTGPAYMRKGSESFEASEEMLNGLIADRSSKAYKVRTWIGKEVVVSYCSPSGVLRDERCLLVDCNQFYLTYKELDYTPHQIKSWPLSRFDLSYHHERTALRLIESLPGPRDLPSGPLCWSV